MGLSLSSHKSGPENMFALMWNENTRNSFTKATGNAKELIKINVFLTTVADSIVWVSVINFIKSRSKPALYEKCPKITSVMILS